MDSEAFRVENPDKSMTIVDFYDGKLRVLRSAGIESGYEVCDFVSEVNRWPHWYERNWTERAKLAYEMLK